MSLDVLLKSFEEISLPIIKEFYLLAQPIVNIQIPCNIKKFEFLARFIGVDGKPISPDKVFSKYQTSSQLQELDLIVFNEALKNLSDYKDSLGSDFRAAINVSEASIKHSPIYFENIEQIRSHYGISKKNIVLELTERANMGIKIFTNKAIRLDYNISVDDFGAEHSSTGKVLFGVFNSVPDKQYNKVNIKLDRFFVERMLDDEQEHFHISRGVLEVFLGFKKSFPDISLTAEGVEDHKITEYLQRRGVDYIQGYAFSKPDDFKTYKQPINHLVSSQLNFDFN